MTSGRYAGGAVFLAAAAIVAVTRPSHAQTAGDGFLFHTPVFTWGIHGGFDRAIAGGDVFSFVTQQLTLDRGDFSSATFGTNLALPVSRSNDIVFDIGYARVSRGSEFRKWVDQNNLPIQQTTSLLRVPVTLGVRHYLSTRGRSIGRFAWIPAARATYVGFGAGLMRYDFHQARAQDAAIDPRWLAYLGCWGPIGVAKSTMCVVPTGDRSTVDLVTIAKGEVTARERIAATGLRVETTRDNCTGSQSAAWSPRGQRLYLHSEDACSGEPAREGTGLIAMSGAGRLLYIQSMTIGTQTGVRVQRYREATADLLLPDDVANALQLGVAAVIQARAAAGAPLATDDVIEASRTIDVAVIEAWLVERADPLTLERQRHLC